MDTSRSPARARPGLAILVIGAALAAGLGTPWFLDYDEAVYAEVANQMWVSGDWFRPVSNCAPFYEKPVLFYWLTASFYKLLGLTPVAPRLVSALALLLGLACLKTSGTQQAGELFREEASDEISPLIEQAMEKQGRLDLQGARRLLEQVLAKEPGHLRALQLLFTLELHQPENRQFHAAAGRLLEKLCSSQETVPQVCAVYRQYCAAARPQRLVLSLYLKLGLAHIEAGELDTSERLLSALLRQKPETAGLPQALLRLADALRRKNEGDKAKRWLQALRATYPESPQARIAATALSERQEGRQS